MNIQSGVYVISTIVNNTTYYLSINNSINKVLVTTTPMYWNVLNNNGALTIYISYYEALTMLTAYGAVDQLYVDNLYYLDPFSNGYTQSFNVDPNGNIYSSAGDGYYLGLDTFRVIPTTPQNSLQWLFGSVNSLPPIAPSFNGYYFIQFGNSYLTNSSNSFTLSTTTTNFNYTNTWNIIPTGNYYYISNNGLFLTIVNNNVSLLPFDIATDQQWNIQYTTSNRGGGYYTINQSNMYLTLNGNSFTMNTLPTFFTISQSIGFLSLTFNIRSAPTGIFIPLNTNANVQFNWGDGTINQQTYNNNGFVHSYTKTGTYNVTVYDANNTITSLGNANGVSYTYNGYLNYFSTLVSVNAWNLPNCVSMSAAFYGATFLQSVPPTLPPAVKDISYMFYNCTSFDQYLNLWNVSNVTNMNSIFSADTGKINSFTNNGVSLTWCPGSSVNTSTMFTNGSYKGTSCPSYYLITSKNTTNPPINILSDYYYTDASGATNAIVNPYLNVVYNSLLTNFNTTGNTFISTAQKSNLSPPGINPTYDPSAPTYNPAFIPKVTYIPQSSGGNALYNTPKSTTWKSGYVLTQTEVNALTINPTFNPTSAIKDPNFTITPIPNPNYDITLVVINCLYLSKQLLNYSFDPTQPLNDPCFIIIGIPNPYYNSANPTTNPLFIDGTFTNLIINTYTGLTTDQVSNLLNKINSIGINPQFNMFAPTINPKYIGCVTQNINGPNINIGINPLFNLNHGAIAVNNMITNITSASTTGTSASTTGTSASTTGTSSFKSIERFSSFKSIERFSSFKSIERFSNIGPVILSNIDAQGLALNQNVSMSDLNKAKWITIGVTAFAGGLGLLLYGLLFGSQTFSALSGLFTTSSSEIATMQGPTASSTDTTLSDSLLEEVPQELDTLPMSTTDAGTQTIKKLSTLKTLCNKYRGTLITITVLSIITAALGIWRAVIISQAQQTRTQIENCLAVTPPASQEICWKSGSSTSSEISPGDSPASPTPPPPPIYPTPVPVSNRFILVDEKNTVYVQVQQSDNIVSSSLVNQSSGASTFYLISDESGGSVTNNSVQQLTPYFIYTIINNVNYYLNVDTKVDTNYTALFSASIKKNKWTPFQTGSLICLQTTISQRTLVMRRHLFGDTNDTTERRYMKIQSI